MLKKLYSTVFLYNFYGYNDIENLSIYIKQKLYTKFDVEFF